MISGFTLNSRGAGEESKKSYIRQSVKDFKLDFIGIHEIVRRDYPANFLKEIGWYTCKGRYGGILLGVNKVTYDVIDKQMGVYFVRFLIASKEDNFTWNLVVVYGDNQQDGKANF
jgi:hypothetical protein